MASTSSWSCWIHGIAGVKLCGPALAPAVMASAVIGRPAKSYSHSWIVAAETRRLSARFAAAGAAGGAAAGTTRTFFKWLFGTSEPSGPYRGFVEKQLHEKGYEVIGWE